MTIARNILYILAATASVSANATPIEYRFNGELSGTISASFSTQDFSKTPFQISIFADTASASYLGKIAGAGSGYVNNSTNATFTIDGIGSALTSNVQIYTLPGVGRIGFGWGGQVFPLNTSQVAQTIIEFNGNDIAINSEYGKLASIVDSTQVWLTTELKNPPNQMLEFTTSIYLSGAGILTLKDFTNVRYSVMAVPEPANGALLLTGLAVVAAALQRNRRHAS